MHMIMWLILAVTHGLAFFGGMAVKNKIVAGLKKENDQLRSSAENAAQKL